MTTDIQENKKETRRAPIDNCATRFCGIECVDEIFWNTHKQLTRCKCEAMYVDSCEGYIRIGGNKEGYVDLNKR